MIFVLLLVNLAIFEVHGSFVVTRNKNVCKKNIEANSQETLRCEEVDLSDIKTKLASIDIKIPILRIYHNSINYLPKNALAKNKVINLGTLDLSMKKLEKVSPEALSKVSADALMISASKLQTFPSLMISKIKSLRTIYFMGSKFNKITKRTFANLTNAGNIRELGLMSCQIETIEYESLINFKKLLTLKLQYNKLKQFFVKLQTQDTFLFGLHLSGNPITQFSKTIISNMSFTGYIKLDNVKFTSFSDEMIQEIVTRRITVDFSGNDLDCGCTLLPLLEMKNKKELLIGKCHTPSKLKDKEVSNLASDDFKNCAHSKKIKL